MIDSLAYTKRLEEVGLSREQAEAHVQIMSELIVFCRISIQEMLRHRELATKRDLESLRVATNRDLESFRAEMRFDMQALRNDMALFKSDILHLINASENRVLVKMGAMMAVMMGLLATFLKLG